MTQDDLDNRFTYHKPKEGQPETYQALREAAKSLAEHINAVCPECREKSLAITELEASIFWANAGIARHS